MRLSGYMDCLNLSFGQGCEVHGTLLAHLVEKNGHTAKLQFCISPTNRRANRGCKQESGKLVTKLGRREFTDVGSSASLEAEFSYNDSPNHSIG